MYLFWPFGRYVEGTKEDTNDEPEAAPHGYDDIEEDEEEETDVDESVDRENGFSDLESAGQTWGRNRLKDQSAVQSNARSEDTPQSTERTRLTREQFTGYGTSAEDTKALNTSSSTDETVHSTPTQTISRKFIDTEPTSQRRVRALGRICYWFAFYAFIGPIMLLVCATCWALVFTIPMAKLLWVLIQHLGTEPLRLHFRSPPQYHAPPDAPNGTLPPKLRAGQLAPKRSRRVYDADRHAGRIGDPRGARILLCIYRAMGVQYYKYTIDGINIIFIDLLPIVFAVIFINFFVRRPEDQPPHTGILGFLSARMTLFVASLLSVIPLSYFIGMAVASISAQSSIGMGSVINATFGSLIELFLYSFALANAKADLVEGSIIGSLLAGVLLMPGVSMIGGAVRRKEQRFNARSAGVTSTMLIMAIIGTLTPTIFYDIYGTVSNLFMSKEHYIKFFE